MFSNDRLTSYTHPSVLNFKVLNLEVVPRPRLVTRNVQQVGGKSSAVLTLHAVFKPWSTCVKTLLNSSLIGCCSLIDIQASESSLPRIEFTNRVQEILAGEFGPALFSDPDL